jgi:hypothetical protein
VTSPFVRGHLRALHSLFLVSLYCEQTQREVFFLAGINSRETILMFANPWMPSFSIMQAPKAWHSLPKLLLFRIPNAILWFCLRFENSVTLGLFVSASIALITHKVILIALHQPLSTCGLVFASPFLFTFDFLTLVLLFLGLTSPRLHKRITAAVFAVGIISLSATFTGFYLEAKAEVNWTRSVAVRSLL